MEQSGAEQPMTHPGFRPTMKILVVDDDETVREALRMRLRDSHDEVVCCRGAREALEYLRRGELPDLIVLDLMMPDMDGWQFRVEQKKHPAWAGIPVIVMSGDYSPQAEAIDAAAYLCKPVEGHIFDEALEKVARELDQRKALARKSEFERLVSLGALVGGIAHEINNPLAFVFGSMDILQRQLLGLARPLAAPEPFSVASALRALEQAKVGAERIAAVVRSASMFASADLESIEPIDVHEVLESSIQIASNEIRHSAHLVRNYDDVPRVSGNLAKLGQVFLNLLLNAIYAIRAAAGRDHVIRVGTYSENNMVVVSIADSATVVDPSVLAAMFEPMSCTATGPTRLHFGLAVSSEVVQNMGGTIEVSAERPQGATFRVRLPGCTRESYAPPPRKPPTRLSNDRAAVLVVDDEPTVCELLAAQLSGPYDVAAFTSSRAALASMLEGNFDVILCDVMMPELNGMDLYARATRERPELAERFIFITGGAFTERARLFMNQTGRPVLRKPCAQEELLETVQMLVYSGARAQENPG
ncbi:MAG: Sensory box histidine kinase/response regulator [Myxococcaceae bacterium]|nr:Sensory box histidine kinase/response regulator [Myxococcaceae bacterium]